MLSLWMTNIEKNSMTPHNANLWNINIHFWWIYCTLVSPFKLYLRVSNICDLIWIDVYISHSYRRRKAPLLKYKPHSYKYSALRNLWWCWFSKKTIILELLKNFDLNNNKQDFSSCHKQCISKPTFLIYNLLKTTLLI